MDKKVAQVVVGLPVDGPFDYFVPAGFQTHIKTGMRVEVIFNHQKKVGYVIGFQAKSAFSKLNGVNKLLDKEPTLSKNMLEVTKSFSEYYGCSWGEAIECALPDALRKTKEIVIPKVKSPTKAKKSLNVLIYGPDRKQIWSKVIELVQKSLSQKKSAVILFSDKKYLKHFKDEYLENIKAPHYIFENLTSKKEIDLWQSVKEEEFCLVLGLRKAVFTPANRLDTIIIIDEDHMAYKQDQTPHYHVNQVARIRQGVEGVNVVLTSVVPSVETWFQAKDEKWKMLECKLSKSAEVKLADLTNYKSVLGKISIPLQKQIEQALETKKKILIVMNRKGYSTFTSCQQCGFVLKCPRCDISLTYSYTQKKLICSSCLHKSDLPNVCPECNQAYLKSWGAGIEKLKNDLTKFYPDAKIALYDNQTKKLPQSAQIVVATQSILSYQDSSCFGLVALMDFDQEINRADYKSHHKVFSLLINLRALAQYVLLVQTKVSDHFILKCVKDYDWQKFYQEDFNFRRDLDLPPHQHLAALGLRGKEEKKVFEESGRLFKMLEDQKEKDVELSEVHADMHPKLRDKYRYTILLKSRSVDSIIKMIKPTLRSFKRKKDIIVTLNVDP